MLSVQDAATATKLYRKYVGSGEIHLSRLYTCIARELRNAELGVQKATPGLITELRTDFKTIGGIARRTKPADHKALRKIVRAMRKGN